MRNFQEIFISGLKLNFRLDDVFPQIQRVLCNSVSCSRFLLARIQISEGKGVECGLHNRILEFHREAVLLDCLRFGLKSEYSCRILLLDVLRRTFAWSLFRLYKLYLLLEAVQHSECVSLLIQYIEEECVRLFCRIIDPDFQTVLHLIELGYYLVRRYALEPERVDLSIWSHEGYIGCPLSQSLLVHYHLL